MTNETLLIVDDSREVVEALRAGFASMNYEVLAAYDGVSGLKMAIAHHPELILLDMNMPGLNGFEVLTALRQANCVSPVIFMTVAGSERIAVEAFRLGVRDYLSKPFTEAELRQSIDRALSETRLVCERDRLTRNLVMAEAVRSTIVTLSHYLNNYLTSLNGGLQLLEENLRNDQASPDILKLLDDSRRSSSGIETVIHVLMETATAKFISYTNTTHMVDIKAALEAELSKLAQARQK